MEDNLNFYILSVNNTLEVPANATCACPEETLTYTCNIVGGGNTLWGGTAFNCPSTSNEIILRHSQFSEGHSGTCSNGVLMGRTIGVTNTNCYTSQLQVDVSTSLNYTTVRCTHDSINSGQMLIGNVSTIKIANGKSAYMYVFAVVIIMTCPNSATN